MRSRTTTRKTPFFTRNQASSMARSANLPQSPERNSTSPTTPYSWELCLPTCRPSPDLHQTRINVSAQKTQQNATMNQNRTNVSAQKDTVVNYCWCLTHQVPLCPERQGPLSFAQKYPTSGGWFVDLAILLAAFPLRSFDFEEQNHYPKDAVFHPKSSEQYYCSRHFR